MPSSLARFNAVLLAAVLAALPALSAARKTETTTPSGPAPGTIVTPLRDPAREPATAATPATPDGREEAPAKATEPKPAPREPIPEGPAPHLALILPLASPTLGSVADAVRLGVLAAAEASGREALPVRVYPAADDTAAALAACRKAQKDGAAVVVAGLTRDGATSLSRSDCPRQPTLALNDPQDPDLPAQLHAISLAIENDARQAALMAVADGWLSAIVIASPGPLARRAQEAFEREWIRAAGEIRRLPFSGNLDDAPALKGRLAGIPGDMVFLALDPAATRAVRPYISGTLPVYTTSLGIDPRAETTVNVDLEGVRYPDMPWFLQPDHPAVMIHPAPQPMAIEQERLYALGIDAYRLGLVLARAESRAFSLDGVTGRITLEASRQFRRALTPGVIDAGRAVPLAAGR